MAQPQPAPAAAPRTMTSGMSRFGARLSKVATREGIDHSIRSFGTTRTVDFLKVANNNEAVQIALTGFMLCGDEETSDEQACAFYLSGLVAILPGLEAAAKNALRYMGYTTRDITMAQAEEYFITILDWIEVPKLAVIFGQAVFILFKHIAEVSYVNFMTQRNNGLKAAARPITELSSSGDIVYSLEKAKMLRGKLGAHSELKAEILNACIANRDLPGPIGRVSNYVCEILAWNEMTYLVFIFETLCLTKSPVLSDPRVQGEVRNLYNAYVVINQTTYPQYFKILNPASAASILMKSKFPTLISLASAIKADTSDSVQKYVTPISTENSLVVSLKQKHLAYMAATATVMQNRHVEYLTEIDPDDQFTNATAAPAPAAGGNA